MRGRNKVTLEFRQEKDPTWDHTGKVGRQLKQLKDEWCPAEKRVFKDMVINELKRDEQVLLDHHLTLHRNFV